MQIPSVPVRPGQATQAKISWFGGPHDPSAGGTPASGIPITTPGIATYNRATLGGYFLVTAPNGRQAVLRQTDLGPSPSTGRGIDFTYSSLPLLGYNERNFPTDATAKATYLGRTVPPQYQHLAGHYQTSAAPPSPQTSQATTSTTTQQFNQAGFRQAQQRYTLGQFLKQSDRGSLDGPGVPGLPSPSSALEPLFKLGAIPTTAPNPQDYTRTVQTAHNTLQQIAGPAGLRVHAQTVPGYRGYVNPLQGFRLGRTDMGVDANAAPGTPIRAIGDSKVVAIRPNWYAGQPYVQLQLLNGPKAGQFYYVAEQVTPHVQPGQVLHAGDTIGTYAPSGTGIEIGWGSPDSRTLAQATTGYSEGQVTRAGQSFRNLLGSLGAR